MCQILFQDYGQTALLFSVCVRYIIPLGLVSCRLHRNFNFHQRLKRVNRLNPRAVAKVARSRTGNPNADAGKCHCENKQERRRLLPEPIVPPERRVITTAACVAELPVSS